MGKLPETLALICLVLVITIMAGHLAAAIGGFDRYPFDSPLRKYFSLEFRRELAESPPALLRDLRIAGPTRLIFPGLGAAVAVLAAWALLRRRTSGAETVRGIGLLSLLLAVAGASPSWASWLRGTGPFEFYTWREPVYLRVAPALALLRVGLAVAIAAHLTALVLGFVAARRGAR